jgi:hypothetical protein
MLARVEMQRQTDDPRRPLCSLLVNAWHAWWILVAGVKRRYLSQCLQCAARVSEGTVK